MSVLQNSGTKLRTLVNVWAARLARSWWQPNFLSLQDIYFVSWKFLQNLSILIHFTVDESFLKMSKFFFVNEITGAWGLILWQRSRHQYGSAEFETWQEHSLTWRGIVVVILGLSDRPLLICKLLLNRYWPVPPTLHAVWSEFLTVS
jgi:hypothetical protein